MVNSAATPNNSGTISSPAKLAHFVLRTSRYAEMVHWYKTALNAHGVFESEMLTFLTYDDEHHRVAIAAMPGLQDQIEGTAGVHHVAFTYDSLKTLMDNYERLRDMGIKPAYVVNHGPTTSLYYQDPDKNQLEFQVENFESAEEATGFFFTEEFKTNPIGVEFDPEEMLANLRAGVPEKELKMRKEDGARSLDDVTLR